MATTRSSRKPAAKDRLDADLEAELEAIAASSGLELVHAEFKGGFLRLFIDRPDGGVTLDDCQHVSKQVSALLDVVDFGRQRYTLEVSSPGLDRQLHRARDYERFTGHKVRVTYRTPERSKRTVVARLVEFDPAGAGGEGSVLLRVEDDQGGEELQVPLSDVQMARLEIEI